MKTKNIILFSLSVITTLIFISCKPGANGAGNNWIDAGNFDRFVSEKNPFIVDIRTPAEFNAGRIKGAVNIPLDKLGASLNLIPEDRTVLIYCRTVNRSRIAMKILSDAGFKNIYALDGGFKMLSENGSKLVEY